MRDARNPRVIAIAQLAEHITAQKVTDAINQLRSQRASALIYGPDVGESAGRSTNTTSTTERNAEEGQRLSLLIDNLYDAIDGLEIAHKHLLHLAEEGVKTRAFSAPPEPPVEQVVCRDNQHGKAGVIEWGDPLCLVAPIKGGMCNKHYMAWYRFRKEHNIDTSHEFAAALVTSSRWGYVQ